MGPGTALTGTGQCVPVGYGIAHTTTTSTVMKQQVQCIPTVGHTSMGPGTDSGQMVRCATAGSGTQDTMPGFTVTGTVAICIRTVGTE